MIKVVGAFLAGAVYTCVTHDVNGGLLYSIYMFGGLLILGEFFGLFRS